MTPPKPSSYFYIYIILIIIFSLLYYLIKDDFYAPYAYMENDYQKDKENVIILLNKSISIAIKNGNNNNSEPFIINSSNHMISMFEIDNNDNFTFKLYLDGNYRNNRSKGLYQQSMDVRFNLNEDAYYTGDPSNRNDEYYKIRYITSNDPLSEKNADLYSQVDRVLSNTKYYKNDFNFFEKLLYGKKGKLSEISGSYFRLLYFSVVVITTLGFGDIVPLSSLARALVSMEAIFGIILIGLYLNALLLKFQKNNLTKTWCGTATLPHK